ncbi:MAG: 4a-hydroxytetrahydrobiopterin dehydratase [Longimicrobiales bacterium]|nr:4a-hydroxytetrahydrobiopterin dehydratase [Longimicrobiales bacterium]
MRRLLDDATLRRWMETHAEWARSGDTLERTFTFPSFPEAVAFVNRVAELAEEMDHHPDLDVRYDRVRVGLSTHSSGGITGMDTALAEKVAAAAGELMA